MALTWREMVLPFYSGGSLAALDLCLIFTPSWVTMNQKFSLVQQNQSVSQALTSNRILCDLMYEVGHKRKSDTASLMTDMPPKAEVARRRCHFRFVPLPEVAMPTGAG
jgi:hypothetical protein